jgi:ATP adenylyltransferase
MNRFPYTTGHCMVAPYRHIGDLIELTQKEASEIMSMAQVIVAATRAALTPEGFNVGFNMGTVAGAGIADHLHMHIVPRWKGDTNFMPVLSDVHIISEHIAKTRDKIKRNLP